MPHADSTAMTPREVLERIQHSALTMDGSLIDLYAPDAVHEWPFPFPGGPARLSGRDQIRAWSGRMSSGGSPFRFERFDNVVVHETADPEVIVVEYTLAGTVTTTGRRGSAPFIGVLRVRDGRITGWREYQNALAIAQAVGRLPDLLAAAQAQEEAQAEASTQ